MTLSASFLGGGFTSKLMREVRVNRGLTYSISSFAAVQRDYGRAAISTFTKNATAKKIIDVIKDTLNSVIIGNFKDGELKRAKGHLVGNYLFRFESSAAYLSQLISLDHMKMKHERLYKFPEIVNGFSKSDVVKTLKELYSWDNMYVVVLGSKSLKKQLEKLGKVTVMSYKKFL
jgi:zinc protease